MNFSARRGFCTKSSLPSLGLVVLGLFFLGTEVVSSAPPVWQVKRLAGRDYLPATQVASFYKLGAERRGDRSVALVGPDRSMVFYKGSREARIDGVKHWLSFPVVWTGGRFYVSRMDLSKTIDPVMRPEKISGVSPVHTVVLDPGHGGHNRGAVNRFAPEKHYNLDICRRIRPYLLEAGLRVVITRSRDEFIPLERRPAMASRLGAGTIFVSIHFNASSKRRSAATGFEVFTLTPRGAPNSHEKYLTRKSFSVAPGQGQDHQSQVLATSIYSAMLGRVPMFDRGVKRSRFAVLRRATTPAVLVEGGFMSNPRDARLIHTLAWRERLAESIAMGVIEFRNLTRTKEQPKRLAQYRREAATLLSAAERNFQPLSGVGAAARPPTVLGVPSWRDLLLASLVEDAPPFQLDFEPRGWAQLEALAEAGEDARSSAQPEQESLAGRGKWPESMRPFPHLSRWRSLLSSTGAAGGFLLWPPSTGPLAEGREKSIGAIDGMVISGVAW